MGYSTYLTFLLGYMSTLVTVYYLAIKNIPFLLDLFPKFVPFAILCTIVGIPTAVGIGWVHLKRSRLYSSEVDVSVEANPYNYKLQPGREREAWFPSMLMELTLLRRLAEANDLLSESEKTEIADLERKIRTLIAGGIIGTPRRSRLD